MADDTSTRPPYPPDDPRARLLDSPEDHARAVAALVSPPPMPLGLPSHGGRVERVKAHTTALVESGKQWAELRIKLAQTEIEDKIQTKVNQIIMRSIPLIMFGVAGLFLLLTLAIGLGWAIKHFFPQLAWVPALFFGFLTFAVLLVLAALGIGYYNRGTLPNPFAGAEVDTDTQTDA